MSNITKTKAAGFYLLLVAAVLEIVSIVRFFLWAPAHDAFDAVIVAALVIGLLLNIVLCVKDIDILVVAMAACYCLAVVRLLMNSVGSFVDKFQNIVMFGDATQVNTILSIAAVMGAGLLLTLIAAFMKREKA